MEKIMCLFFLLYSNPQWWIHAINLVYLICFKVSQAVKLDLLSQFWMLSFIRARLSECLCLCLSVCERVFVLHSPRGTNVNVWCAIAKLATQKKAVITRLECAVFFCALSLRDKNKNSSIFSECLRWNFYFVWPQYSIIAHIFTNANYKY